MSLTPSFHYEPDLVGTKAKWSPFKNGTEYRDNYSEPQLAAGVDATRIRTAELEATIRSLPASTGQELRTMRVPNTQPAGEWPLPSFPAPQR